LVAEFLVLGVGVFEEFREFGGLGGLPGVLVGGRAQLRDGRHGGL